MLYENRNVVFWGNALLLLTVLLFGVSLALAGRGRASAEVTAVEPDAVAVMVTVYHPSSHLQELLDILAETRTPAAFFVSASAVREAPALIERMRRDGHTVGTLGFRPLYDGEQAAVETDLRIAADALSACEVEVRYYHSGFRAAETSKKAAKALGLKWVRGTVDLRTAAGTAADILARSERIKGGSIVVVQPTAALNDAARQLLSALRERYRITGIWEEEHDTKTA